MEYVIDAKQKRLGRVASEIATILQGKKSVSYDPKQEGKDRVVVRNVSGLTVSGEKTIQKIYYRHSGRLGHLKKKAYHDVFAKNPAWVLRHAVYLMLPKNRLRARRMKRLVIV